MKKDIKDKKDIEKLVRFFYDKVMKDETLAAFFAKVNWEKHIPVMVSFWENAIFYNGTYSGNPMKSHKRLHEKQPLHQKHFTQWLFLFLSSVDELFEGRNATVIKQKASSISTVMSIKIIMHSTPGF